MQVCSQKKKYYIHFYLIYAALFLAVCLLAFNSFYRYGRTTIWNSDGFMTHYKTLVYYGRYLRSIIKSIVFEHRFVLPEWEFNLGEGSDIVQSLHYYVVGDPFAAVSVFFPDRYMWICYELMVFLRMFLAGAAFSAYCFYMRAGRDTAESRGQFSYAVLAGTLAYVFCFWGINNAARHNFFLNPMLYLPLLLLGAEKIFREEKSRLFTIAVFLSAISNFYFFYMLVLITVIYVLFRMAVLYHGNIKQGGRAFLKVLGSSVLGVVMAGVILVPMVITFFQDTRSSISFAHPLFYPLHYYEKVFGGFISGEESFYMCTGYSAVVLIAVFLLFLRRKNWQAKFFFLTGVIIAVFPVLGQVMNGFSYMANRWSWALAMVCACILVLEWDDLMNLRRSEAVKLFACTALYCLICWFTRYSKTWKQFGACCVAAVFCCAVFPLNTDKPFGKLWKKWRPVISLCLTVAGILSVAVFRFSHLGDNYAASAVAVDQIEAGLNRNETMAIRKVIEQEEESGDYRYSGRTLVRRGDLLAGISSTKYGGSISNPFIGEYRSTLEMRDSRPYVYENYDDRTIPTSLTSVKYYSLKNTKSETDAVPYGFAYTDTVKVRASGLSYKIYTNEYALPVGYAYNSIIPEEEWEALSAVEKQEAMLQTAVVGSDYSGSVPSESPELISRSMEYTIELPEEGISLTEDGFVVTDTGRAVSLKFDGMKNSETYLVLGGLDFEGSSVYNFYFGDKRFDPGDSFSEERWNALSAEEKKTLKQNDRYWTETGEPRLYFGSDAGEEKTLIYYTENSSMNNNQHDFSINMYYHEEPLSEITLSFSHSGIYSFDELKVVCQPMDNYAAQAEELRSRGLEDIVISTDKVRGSISVEEPVLLCMTIPYSAGWKAYVDGQETQICHVNVKNIGIEIGAGTHDVELIYHTPYLRLGMLVSAAGFVLFLAAVLYNKMKENELKKQRGSKS